MNDTQKLMREYRRQFYLAYHKKVLPLLKRFEFKRKSYLNITKLIELIIVIAVVCLFIFGAGKINLDLMSAIAFIFYASAIMVPIYISKKFVKELKTYCLKPIIDIFGAITWKQNVIDTEELRQSELFSNFNRRKTDDGFEGEYKGVKFEIAEIHLGLETSSGKNRHYHDVFNGVVIKFASNKPIRAKTMITTKGDKFTGKTNTFILAIYFIPVIAQAVFSGHFAIVVLAFGLIGLFFIIYFVYEFIQNKKKNSLNPICLEDPLFKKKFNAYSADEIEGRYLITTAFMERFMNLQTAFGAKNAKCTFFDDTIMFAISTKKNLFEIGNLFKNLENPKQIETFFNEFASILLLVEHFKLDQKTGL